MIDAGRAAITRFMRAGLSMPSLAAVFVRHLHADHTVDLFSFPLLSAGVVGKQGFQKPIVVYGPGSAGCGSVRSSRPRRPGPARRRPHRAWTRSP
ncbi:hypothetical protein ABT299_42005 [Spirillospora sp. NPDC000708]